MTREELLNLVWEEQDTAYDLMCEYDGLPHHYGENILYQAEGHLIDLIALYPGITTTDLAGILKKTVSACSQLVHKMRKKGWIKQTRNENNNRQYNLELTESGQKVYKDHAEFSQDCQKITFDMLNEFSKEDLERHIAVQKVLNEAYRGDIRRSRERIEQSKAEGK